MKTKIAHSFSIIKLMMVTINLLVFLQQTHSQWFRTNGPSGGTISDIEKIGDYLAVVTVYGEAYFSSDDGNNWIERAGLPSSFAPRLAARGNELFAATQAGVFVTNDFGVNWNQLSQGLGNKYIREIAIQNDIVFAFSDEFTVGNVYQLNDATQAWQLVGPYTTTSQTIYNAYVKDEFIFLSVLSGILRSADSGATWEFIGSGLPIGGVYGFSSNQNKLFVGTSNGLYFSGDNGNSWETAGLEGFRVWSTKVSNDTLYAGTSGFGVFRSTDYGVSWEDIGIRDKWVFDLEVSDGFIFAGTNFIGMFRTQVDNISWTLINENLFGMPVSSFINMGQKLVAGAYGGLFITSDMGDTWLDKGQFFPPTDQNTELRGSHLIYDVATDQQNNIIYAGSNSAIYKSIDFGENWTITGQPIVGNGRIEALLVSTIDPDTTRLLAGKGTGSNPIGLFTSVDEGQNWTYNDFGAQNVYILDIKRKGSMLFAAAGYSTNGGVYRSIDNGVSWTKTSSGLPTDLTVETLFVTNQGEIFAGTDGGLFRTSDNGNSWVEVWDNSEVTGITTDSQGILYASSESSTYKGIYRSLDNGNTWQAFNEGLTFLPDVVFSITYKEGYLFAGIDRLGVWKRLVDPNVAVTELKDINSGLSISQNVPNPFSQTTRIPFRTAKQGNISLDVFDQHGKQIGSTQQQFFTEGEHSILFDASALQPGIYIFKLYSIEDVIYQKFIVAR